MRHIVIIGATSAIAMAAAHRFAADGAKFLLAARHADKLAAVADDLRVAGGGAVDVDTVLFDAVDETSLAALVETARQTLGRLDLVLIAHGSLPEQRACEASAEITLREIDVNALSVISLLTRFAPVFAAQKQGTLAVVSSAAGERGRQSNYVYGAAKGMVTLFLEGLRNRLDRQGVHVLTVKPGFVDTPMTADFDKGGLLWAKPETVGEGIYRAVIKRRDVVYLPWFWRYIMLIIRHIPERLFKRMNL